MHATLRTTGPRWRTRLAAVAAAVVTGTASVVVAAEPARAADPRVTLDCEWHLDWYNCSFTTSGFHRIDAIHWFVNRAHLPAYDGLDFLSRDCMRVGKRETVEVLVVGTENALGEVAADADAESIPCNCLPGF